ncbi:hypothetical protein F4810DRAFT_708888 [Camillea tinctor]|nr:hypothetical protein F4810DRAFT_708888 [Camillea tinctor]
MSTPPLSQLIPAPSRTHPLHAKSVFLAGSTSGCDWRAPLIVALSGYPVTIYDPARPDWDGSWVEDGSFAPWREQVAWELEKQEAADLTVVYFGAGSLAPVSLLEFGLAAGRGREVVVVVVVEEGYAKRGNVKMVCERFGIVCLESGEGLGEVVVEKLGLKR